MSHYPLFLIGFLAYVFQSWRVQRIISHSVVLNPFQKKLHSILNWMIPFIWGVVVITLFKPSGQPTMTKRNRKRHGSGTDGWENLTGGQD